MLLFFSLKGQSEQQSLLWKVTHPETSVASFIFGTIHMIDEDYFFIPDTLHGVIQEVDEVCFELNISDPMEMMMSLLTMGDKLFFPDSITIDDFLSVQERDLLDNQIKNSSIPVGMVKKLKPFFISTLLVEKGASTSNTVSYEVEINRLAEEHGKNICGLESIEEQLALFDHLSIEDQVDDLVAQLKHSTKENVTEGNPMDELIHLYISQDLEGLDTLIKHQIGENTSGFTTENILSNRNENWVERIEMDMIEGGEKKLYAVGAGHLTGEDGVIAMLKNKGFSLAPVMFRWKQNGTN